MANRVSQRSVVGLRVKAHPIWSDGILNAKKLPTFRVSPLGAGAGGFAAGAPPLPPLLWTGGTAWPPAGGPVVEPPVDADFLELEPQPARRSASARIAAKRRGMVRVVTGGPERGTTLQVSPEWRCE